MRHILASLVFLTFWYGGKSYGQWVATPIHGITTTLAVTQANTPSPLLFGGTWEGVFISSNEGMTWNSASTGMADRNVEDIVSIGTNSSTPILFASTAYVGDGIFRSTDNGAHCADGEYGLICAELRRDDCERNQALCGWNGGGRFSFER
ncbi:MAG TPA: hypothetical protein VGM92_06205 [Candidatus Kapabacteria bacterium]